MKTILSFILIFSAVCFSAPKNITCYVYELQGDNLVLVDKQDRPVIVKDVNKSVLILDKEQEPTQEQLNAVKRNIQLKVGKNVDVEKEIEKLKEAILKLQKGEDISGIIELKDKVIVETQKLLTR